MEITNYCKFFRRDVETCRDKNNPRVIAENVCPWSESDQEAKQECPKYQDIQIPATSRRYPQHLRD